MILIKLSTNSYFSSDSRRGILLFVLTSIMWSSSGVLIKLISWNPVSIAGARSIIAAVVIAPFIDFKKFEFTIFNILSGFSFTATVILFVSATKTTTAANAIILQYTAPIYTALFSWPLLRERVRPYDIIFTITATTGITLFFMDITSKGQIIGNVMALFSGLSFAWFYILMRKQRESSPINSAFIGNILTFLISLPFIILHPLKENTSFIFLLILGVFQMGIPMLFYSIGIKHVTALNAILISTLEPILNPIWVFLFVHEKPGYWSFIGGTLVIASIVLRQIVSIKKGQA